MNRPESEPPSGVVAREPGAPVASLEDAREAGLAIVTLPVASVRVRRGLEVIVDDVFEHEVPILKLMHGDSNVELTLPAAGEEFVPKELIDSAEDEFFRLEAVYANKKANFVRGVYPRGAQDLATATGLSLGSGRVAHAQESSIRAGGKKVGVGPPTRKKQAKAAKK